MAYSTTNQPFLMTMPPIAGGFRDGSSDAKGGLWYYQSTHATSDVRAAGFFSNARTLGMHVGDPIFVWDSVNSDLTLSHVTAISTAGAASLSTALTT